MTTLTTDTRTFSQKLNSRKLMLTVGIIATASGLLVTGFISGDNWVNVVSITAGAYMATQVWQDRGKV